MSATTELLKGKQKYITEHKCYPTRLTITPAFKKELLMDQIYKKKASSDGSYYMGCYIEIGCDQEEPYIFSGGERMF